MTSLSLLFMHKFNSNSAFSCSYILIKMNMLFFFFLLLPFVNSIHFKFDFFGPEATNIAYHGDAISSVGVVELINKIDYTCRVGWATYNEKIPLWDSNSGKISDFSTHFTFIIDTQNALHYGHGLAFFLAPVGFQIPPNSASGFLGLFNTTTIGSPQNQIVMVEFDSFRNEEWDPKPLVEHVGINNNSLQSVVYTSWNASYHSGDTANVWITYNSSTKNLTVLWSYEKTANPQEKTHLSYAIDLTKVLPEFVTVGFSAATGRDLERHQLLSWEFNSTLVVKDANPNSSNKTRIIVGVAVAVCIVGIGMIIGILFTWKRRKMAKERKGEEEKMNLTSINKDLERGTGPRRFSYQELVSATNNFSSDRMLGRGGFGSVYKGYLIDSDLAIAVKRISSSSRQGKKEYIAEVKTIGQLRHRNLVQLLGWCHDKGEFLLVYEFMPNGSLDAHLFGKKTSLTWAARQKISLGLASGLLYLHEEWEQCVVHRDVKSSNVMLDSNFNAKVGDFGLARLMDHELGPQTTALAGTLGYLAPEYITTKRASKESDVYSFGVVAIEIATGRRAIDHINDKHEMSLVEWVWELYGDGKLHLAVDKEMYMEFDEKEAECLMIVGLWCAHPDRNLRPSIRQAIQVLKFESAFPNLPAKMPVPVYHVPEASASSSEPSITNSSLEIGR
ncbi:L-type lectin-domain containing receptor kinase IX.1-like [Mercurialis annua]|uniref:L-type lectin-domain containing receptor kinase IX.1-like n=1 Tax=Mercurialis annua TaxID=3986 RepID=UPI00215E2DEE|nr:L-type lectin-domain containing receptor kinase IX.1-like [Mercurialis annua]